MNQQTENVTAKLTNQIAFNQIAEHLMTQGEQCTSNEGCLYRKVLSDHTVLKCALGIFIPDELYTEEMEHQAFDKVIEIDETGFIDKLTENVDIKLLGECQDVHDRGYTVVDGAVTKAGMIESFKIGLCDVARLYKLEIPDCLK